MNHGYNIPQLLEMADSYSFLSDDKSWLIGRLADVINEYLVWRPWYDENMKLLPPADGTQILAKFQYRKAVLWYSEELRAWTWDNKSRLGIQPEGWAPIAP